MPFSATTIAGLNWSSHGTHMHPRRILWLSLMYGVKTMTFHSGISFLTIAIMSFSLSMVRVLSPGGATNAVWVWTPIARRKSSS